MSAIQIKRIYTPAAKTDGYRVLVDRLWPRGIRKESAALDGWIKSVAPSTELRKSFNHEAGRFDEFRAAYTDELDKNPDAAAFAGLCEKELLSQNVTLLYAAKDEIYNNASVLCKWIRQKIERGNNNG